MKIKKLVLATACCVLFGLSVYSQCTDILTAPAAIPDAEVQRKIARAKEELKRIESSPVPLTEAQIKDRNARWADQDMLEAAVKSPGPETVPVTLVNKSLSIKLTVDNDVDSGYNKSEDYVPFSVAEDVTVTVFGDRRCVVIPKDTKVYGIVDYAKGRTPFRLRGKARLYVYVETLMLANGTPLPISFAEPMFIDDVRGNGTRTRKKVIKQCEIDRRKMCIVGRLSRTAFAPGLIGAGAGNVYAFKSNEVSNTAAALTLIKEIANASGVSDFINQSNAGLKQKHVFEATNTNDVPILIWISAKKAEPKEPEKSKE